MEIDAVTGMKLSSPIQISTLFPDPTITGPLQAVWQTDTTTNPTIHVLTQVTIRFDCRTNDNNLVHEKRLGHASYS